MPNLSSFRGNKEKLLEYYRKYREKNAEKLREYNRKYNKIWRKKNGYYNEEKYKKKYPLKYRAHWQAQNAVRRGKLKRGKCMVCRKLNAQAHHDDYNECLKIKWLCPLHHKQYHIKKLKNKKLLTK